MSRQLLSFGGQFLRSRGGNPLAAYAVVSPSFETTYATDTPEDRLNHGVYSSSSGSALTLDITYYVDGSPVAADYDLAEGEVLYAVIVVSDASANEVEFTTEETTVLGDAPLFIPSGSTGLLTSNASTFRVVE